MFKSIQIHTKTNSFKFKPMDFLLGQKNYYKRSVGWKGIHIISGFVGLPSFSATSLLQLAVLFWTYWYSSQESQDIRVQSPLPSQLQLHYKNNSKLFILKLTRHCFFINVIFIVGIFTIYKSCALWFKFF